MLLTPLHNPVATRVDPLNRVIPIFVQNFRGRTVVLLVELQDDVGQVKEAISRRERVPVQLQRLLYQGKVLESGKKLTDYAIVRDSTLHLVAEIRGGGLEPISLPDVRNPVIKNSGSGPKWLRYDKGLALETKCSNNACEAYDKSVLNPVGFSNEKGFDMNEQIAECCCPICKKITGTGVKNLILYACQYSYRGVIKNKDGGKDEWVPDIFKEGPNGNPTQEMSPLKNAPLEGSGQYLTFDEKEVKSWKFMKIVVKPIPPPAAAGWCVVM